MFLENYDAFRQEGSVRNISTNCFLLFFILFFHCFPALISLRVSIQGEKFLVVTEFDPASQCMSHILQIKPQAKCLTLNFGGQSQRPKDKSFVLRVQQPTLTPFSTSTSAPASAPTPVASSQCRCQHHRFQLQSLCQPQQYLQRHPASTPRPTQPSTLLSSEVRVCVRNLDLRVQSVLQKRALGLKIHRFQQY